MAKIVRFGVSLDKNLLQKFDIHSSRKGYTNRSEALRDLIRDDLVKKEWQDNQEVTGAITLVYDHHKRELLNHLMELQHDYHEYIISTQHIHLDHDNCLEIVVVKGNPKNIEMLYGHLKSAKGVKHAGLSMATLGKEIL
jgi:CopG family transcriptional regulator, nickel-responsive regulator